MKRLIALTLVTLGVTVSARAQWVVYDPTAHMQSIMNTAQEIAQFVEGDSKPGAADPDAQRPTQRVQTLREPVRRSQGRPAHDGPAAGYRPAQDGTRPDTHGARRGGGCGPGHALRRQRPVHAASARRSTLRTGQPSPAANRRICRSPPCRRPRTTSCPSPPTRPPGASR